MPYRSSFSRGALAASVALLACALAFPALCRAADPPVVAGPTASGFTATARLAGGKLCVEIVPPTGAEDSLAGGSIGDTGCEAVPVLAPLGASDLGASGEFPKVAAIAGVVGSDVAGVELKRAGKVVGRADTQPSPLPGAAAEVRFYVVERSSADRPDELAYLDAAGTVRRAVNVGSDPSLPSTFRADQPETGGRTIARGRRGGATWTLRSSVRHVIASTPLEPERRVTLPCATVTRTSGSDRNASSACDAIGRERDAVIPLISDSCGPLGRIVGGLARPGVVRLVAVLGDGRRKDAPLRAMPGGGGMRAGVVALGSGVAVRSLVGLGADGRTVATESLGLQPLRPTRCGGGMVVGGGVILTYAAAPSETALSETPLGPAPHHVTATDDGAQLCLGLDRAPRPPADCLAAPVAEDDLHLQAVPAAGGRYVVGLVTPAVATARLTLSDGSTRDVPATPIPGYTGRYATTVKVVAADVAGTRHVVHYALRDARGRVLTEDTGPERPPLRRVATLGHVAGRAPLTLWRYPRVRGVASYTTGPCVAFGRPDAQGSGCLPTYPDFVIADARCDERRIVITGALTHRTDTLAVRLADGRERRGRTFPFPAGTDRPSAAMAVVVLGPHDAPRTLIRRGSSPRRRPMALPPAARQCGYQGVVDFAPEGS